MTYHQALGASFDPFAFAQQTATAVQQAADVAQKTAQAAQQVTNIFAPPPPPAPAAAPAAAKRPFALMQPALMLRSLPRGPLTKSIRPIGPSFGPSNLPPSPPADKEDDKDADKKSNTGMFIALGLAAVAAVVLLRKRG